ncbi:MAG: hypothetical protein M3336_14040 [Chloroflexota bacterium]|nr:hypothetical protein [Chloroflexota bacterium]
MATKTRRVMSVHAERPELWESIARVLGEHGAHHLRHYGRLAMTTF